MLLWSKGLILILCVDENQYESYQQILIYTGFQRLARILNKKLMHSVSEIDKGSCQIKIKVNLEGMLKIDGTVRS